MATTEPGPDPSSEDAAARSRTSEQVARGIPWSLAAQVMTRSITLLTTIVLARLLVPADFGLVALAVLALAALNVLSDLGLTSVLVVRQDLDRRGQGTLLTLLLVAGAVCAVTLAVLAPMLADLFREPRLTDVLRALSAVAFISGVSWFYDMLLQRELEFRKRFMAQLARNVTYAGVAVTMAVVGAGVWSLVVGQLAAALVVSVVLVWLAPYRVRPAMDPVAARSTLKDGRGFLLQAAATTVQDNVDFLVVGRTLGVAPLGVYSMAYRLGELPYAGVADPVARVTFPAFARMRHEGQDVSSGFLRTLRTVALITLPLGMLLSGAADPFTRAVLGDKWLPMIGPLAIMGLWAALRSLETILGWFLNALGQAGRSGRISVVLLVPLVPALFLAASTGGVSGVAWTVLGHLTITLLLQSRVAHRHLGVSAPRQWRALRPLVLPAAGCWGAARLAAVLTEELPSAAGLAASGAAGIVAYVLLVRLCAPELLASTLNEARRAVRRGG